ncbi:MAG: glycosyltransferase [Polynucleobacter sp.]|uniref:glycosyltransferase n=1 Tax=Polynucleobacter sp. TaxID=2029855 RepID=UPI00271BD175|nr:glycosyltransferase [Polynucleobacter sp.]MDO8713806.1 glycosyltransferase [Polynucleobacter sp.]
MKIVTWMSVLTEHQAHTYRELEVLSGEPVEYVLGAREIQERRLQGWTELGLSGLSVHDLPNHGWWQFGKKLIAQYPEAVHIFNGMWGDRRFFPLLVYAQGRGVRTCLVTEPYADSVVSYFSENTSLLDRIKFAVRPWMYKVAGSILARRMSAVFAISSKAVNQFRAMGFEGERVFPFGYFVPPAIYHDVADLPCDVSAALRLVFVGSLIERKGLTTLLEAMKLCHDSNVHVLLDVYGPGSPPGPEAIPPGVELRGVVSFGQVQSVVRNYDVLVLPSLHDGWGVVVNEALLQGVPVIVSDAVGARTLVEKSGAGALFVASDSDGLARVISDLAEAPQLLEQWRKAAADFQHQLSPETAANYLYDCLLFVSGTSKDKPDAQWYV